MNKTPAVILIVDDEEMIRESLIDILEDEGYRTLSAENAEDARKHYNNHRPDLILLDIWMPDTDGISLLRQWQSQDRFSSAVIMMSGHGTIETAVEATKLGAYYFLEKPLSTSKLLLTIERALQTQTLMAQNAALKAQIDPPVEIIGKAPQIQHLQEQALDRAVKNTPILLCGKSGSGKQHLARYIHQNSPWREGKFITLPTAAFEAKQLLPALLGNSRQSGLIAQADNGTLYIDEISRLPADVQQLLCHLISEHNYLPGDGGSQQSVFLRLIAGSAFDPAQLKDMIDAQLYDRLTVAHIALPPLAEHSSDVPELLDYFSKHFADHEQLPYRHFTLAAQNTLRQHRWPGNIRELKNLVQRLLIQSNAPEIDSSEAEAALTPVKNQIETGLWSQIVPLNLSLREAREEFERQYLLEQFRLCDGNIAKLADRVGMDRTNLYRKLRSLGIDPTLKPQ